MTVETPKTWTLHMGRREFVLALSAGGVVSLTQGCGYFPPEQGAAYTPWSFPAASYPDPRLVVVHAAILGSNPHNTQPWRFTLDERGLSLFADRSRRLGAMDPIERELMVGLGCALENALIAARSRGFTGQLRLLPDPTDPTHVARIDLAPTSAMNNLLFAQIPRRRTHRGAYAEVELPEKTLTRMAALASIEEGPQLRWLTSPELKQRFTKMTVAATRAIVNDLEMSQASYRWYRHTHAEIESHRDGLTLDAMAVSPLMSVAGKIMPRASRSSFDDYWVTNTAEIHCKHVSAFGILSTRALRDPVQQLRVGRAYQRAALYATSEGLALQPLNQAAERRDRELERGLPPEFGDQLAALLEPGLQAQMLFRIGKPVASVHHSPRRDPLQLVKRV